MVRGTGPKVWFYKRVWNQKLLGANVLCKAERWVEKKGEEAAAIEAGIAFT